MASDDQIRQMIRQEIQAAQSSNRFHLGGLQRHIHNGLDSPKVNQADIVPSVRAMGTIAFAQAVDYRIGIKFNPTQVQFFGGANRVNSVFTVTAANATVGAVYTNNGFNFTVLTTIAGGTTLTTYGSGPAITVNSDGTFTAKSNATASGTLTKASGTGDATITFSVVSASFAIRTIVVGNAQLGPSFYFQPLTSTSVSQGGIQENVIQASFYFGVETSSGAVHALADQTHLVDVEWPASGTIVARATITTYTGNALVVNVSNLADGWFIYGNYVVT